MNRRILYFLITLICISLTGIIAVQFFWIRNAIRVREAQFDQNVFEALGKVASKLETDDNLRYMGKYQVGDSIRRVFNSMLNEQAQLSDLKHDSVTLQRTKSRSRKGPPPRQKVVTYNLTYNMQSPGGSIIIDTTWSSPGNSGSFSFEGDADVAFNWNENEFERLDSLMRIQNMNLNYGFGEFFNPMQEFEDYDMIIQYSMPGNPIVRKGSAAPPETENRQLKEQVRKLNAKAKKFQDAIKQMTIEMEIKPRSLEERIDKRYLADILRKFLSDKDISRPFEFAVIQPGQSYPLTKVRSEGFNEEDVSTKYRVSLFPNDILQKQYALLLNFQGPGQNILAYLSWLMIASVLFTLIIMITSGMSIYVMIRQKKISDIKTDFINNMTHEFKTPIATISIAVDSINNPKVIGSPDVIRNYTRVIKEENRRMNTRVEQVLQMALLDSSGFRLNEKEVDLHEIIRRVTDNIRLQVESREGQLLVDLDAERPVITADESHISNVMISILDNAIKYSEDRPGIRVSTRNRADTVIISIEDHGIGMSPETQKKIFDKFYRVTSGNIHNVKGFGLGLSYAKAIVLAHHGEIRVQSEPGSGTRFEVVLPLPEIGSHI